MLHFRAALYARLTQLDPSCVLRQFSQPLPARLASKLVQPRSVCEALPPIQPKRQGKRIGDVHGG